MLLDSAVGGDVAESLDVLLEEEVEETGGAVALFGDVDADEVFAGYNVRGLADGILALATQER